MKLGLIGLGRMGGNMVKRLLQGGHEVVIYNRTLEKMKPYEAEGAIATSSVAELVEKLPSPKVVWLMLPAGQATEAMIEQLRPLLAQGDIIVEGGNSKYTDDSRRAESLKAHDIHYVDAGVSGGIWGLKVGYCTMVGGDQQDIKVIEPALKTLAPEGGYLHCGPTGAGHYVKMVHNGIEYAMMQAYGEGFELLKASPYGENLKLEQVAHLWNQGSVVRSWLLELLESAFGKDADLAELSGYVQDSGEGRWTVLEAVERGVAATGLAHALFNRFLSRQQDSFSNKVIAALRNEFGGHAVEKAGAANKSTGAGAGAVEHAKAQEVEKQ